jgi:hypothetical protein
MHVLGWIVCGLYLAWIVWWVYDALSSRHTGETTVIRKKDKP